jgi:hypothetical protein
MQRLAAGTDRTRNVLADACAFLLLTALNLSICWRLFKVEFTNHFSSIEGSFIAIARYISRHWGDFSWWPLWHCGMPYQNTYVPLLHIVVAATSSIAHLPPARAYHAVVGLIYALGAGTLFLMTTRLGASRPAAFVAAVLYSVFSPSSFLMPGVAGDLGGFFSARRLQVLTVYGEGPHVSCMTLLPIVILALQVALEKGTRRAFAFAAIPIALVFAMNVPGTMATGVAVFCWICVQPASRRLSAWKIAAGASLFAYFLASFAIPPSSLATVGGNVGSMHPGFSTSLKYGPVPLAFVLGAVAALGYWLARTPLSLPARFAILFSGLLVPLSATASVDRFELLPQVGRLHLEAEMGVCILLGCAGWWIYRHLPWQARPILLALFLAFTVRQTRHYRVRARMDLDNVKLEKRSEFTTARWLDRNLGGGRVYAMGSTAFWLNAFTDTPQLIGCCDQGLSMPVLSQIPYPINAQVTKEDTVRAGVWLRALGVRAIVVNGPASTDEYKDIKAPERFRDVFPALQEENGDTVYAVLPAASSLAHVLRPGDQVPITNSRDVPFADVSRYADAIANESRAVAFTWLGSGRARIRAQLHPDDLLSVQVAWFPGWTASVGTVRKSIVHDGLGFILLRPECEGDCEVTLSWSGPPDLPFAQGLSVLAAVAALFAIFYRGGAAGATRFRRAIHN